MNAGLDQLLDFLRTRSDPGQLSSPQRLGEWLADRNLLEAGEPVDEADVRRVVHVRAALLSLIAQHMGAPLDPRTGPTLEAVTQAAPLRLTLDPGGDLQLAAGGSGVDRALAELVSVAYRVALTDDLRRLKVCKGCGWAFYDTSKNRSRIWCDMATCGSQEKARAYRARHRAHSKPAC